MIVKRAGLVEEKRETMEDELFDLSYSFRDQSLISASSNFKEQEIIECFEKIPEFSLGKCESKNNPKSEEENGNTGWCSAKNRKIVFNSEM